MAPELHSLGDAPRTLMGNEVELPLLRFAGRRRFRLSSTNSSTMLFFDFEDFAVDALAVSLALIILLSSARTKG